MQAQAALAAFTMAMKIAELLAPQIQSMVQRGEISADQQKAARDAYDSLKASGDKAFSGPEWDIAP